MLSAINFSELINFALLLFGVALLIKKVAEMERFHYQRVFLLTLFITGLIFYLLDHSFGEYMRLASTCVPEIADYSHDVY